MAFGRINDVAGLARHPQLRVMATETPAGPIEVIAPPTRVKSDGAPESDRVTPLRVPSAGEHTEAIRREFAAAPARVAGTALLDPPERDAL